MAKLELGAYTLEFGLNRVNGPHCGYHLLITCNGLNFLEPLVRYEEAGMPKGTLHFRAPCSDPFDEAFRPLITEDFPVKWTDDEVQWIDILGFPSSFLDTLNPPLAWDWEYAWIRRGEAVQRHLDASSSRSSAAELGSRARSPTDRVLLQF